MFSWSADDYVRHVKHYLSLLWADHNKFWVTATSLACEWHDIASCSRRVMSPQAAQTAALSPRRTLKKKNIRLLLFFFFIICPAQILNFIIGAYWVKILSGKTPDNIQPTTNHFIVVCLLHNSVNQREVFIYLFIYFFPSLFFSLSFPLVVKKWWFFWSWLRADNFTRRGPCTENDAAL